MTISRSKKFFPLFFFSVFLFSFSPLKASDESTPALDTVTSFSDHKNFDDLQAASYTRSPQKKRAKKYHNEKRARKADISRRNSWTPHFEESYLDGPRSSVFFQADIGLGMLYFNRVKGNLMGTPRSEFVNNWNTAEVEGGLSYNRTPLYEFVLGYRFFRLFRLGLCYQHQGNITVQTPLVSAGVANPFSRMILTSNLALDTIMLKGYVDLPWPLVIKNAKANFYLGTAIGPGWQSWNSIQMLRTTGGVYGSSIQPIRGKYRVSAVWTLDAGFRVGGFDVLEYLSVVAGCKFTLWGNSGNIGKLSQQGTIPLGLQSPFRVRRIHQWAPYVGVQWNFPEFYYLPRKARLTDDLSPLLTQMNVGIGFLNFKKVKGNLISKPQTSTTSWVDLPVSKLRYNRTPLSEYLIQHRFNKCLQLGFSYQNQAGVSVQNLPVTTSGNGTLTGDYAQITANLNLNALLLKGFVMYPDIFLGSSLNLVPYFGLGFGPSWQSWSRVYVLRTFDATNGLAGGYQPVRQKISANCMLNLDWGIRLSSANPNYRFSWLAGCKFNLWGQTRYIGLDTQQGSYKVALIRPLTVRTIDQWAPYLGVQWTFPSIYRGKKPYYLEGLSPNTWVPYFISIRSLESCKGFYTLFNAGIGLLYFKGVKGNIAAVPGSEFSSFMQTAPVQGRFTYNKTPLYEYLLGYQVNSWLKGAFSYQHQGNVTVQTKPLDVGVNTITAQNYGVAPGGQRAQFSSDLTLDVFLVKAVFEFPWPMVWRNLVYSPYASVGTGVAWQTWKRIEIVEPVLYFQNFDSLNIPLRQKVSFNAAFHFDLGIRMQSPFPDTGFSVLAGLKFNLYGQARQMGNIQQGYMPRYGLLEPMGIKSVYQWAPYAGIQWKF